MKKFFGFGKKKQAPSKQLEESKAKMAEYKGQKYNPAEDDGITTESLFKVVDGSTGERIDVRELLGISEQEFKDNPELAAALAYMGEVAPVEAPKEEETKEGNPEDMDQKQRHFIHFDMLTQSSAASERMDDEQVAGAADEVIQWDSWWERKETTNTELMEAIQSDNTKKVQMLLNDEKNPYGMPADVNMRVQGEETPLHRATLSGNVDIIKILLENFAEVNSQDSDGKSALHMAAFSGNATVVKLLCSRQNIIIDLIDEEGNTALHCAAQNLNEKVIATLLGTKRCDLSVQNVHLKTAYDLFLIKSKMVGQAAKYEKTLDLLKPESGNW